MFNLFCLFLSLEGGYPVDLDDADIDTTSPEWRAGVAANDLCDAHAFPIGVEAGLWSRFIVQVFVLDLIGYLVELLGFAD